MSRKVALWSAIGWFTPGRLGGLRGELFQQGSADSAAVMRRANIRLADERGLPYQKLIDPYVLNCVKKREKLAMKGWRSSTAQNSRREASTQYGVEDLEH
jgi:hypothetical protein